MLSKYPNTLDAEIHMRAPGPDFGAQFWRNNELEFQIGGKKQPYEATMLTPMLSDQVDWKAPGVREHQMNPPISLGPFRSSIYDVQRPFNAAPVPDYNDTVGFNTFLFGPWAQRTGASNFQLVKETELLDNIQFWNLGQWSQALTGVSPLKDFKPNSTVPFIN